MKKRIILRVLMFIEGLIALFAVCCALFYWLSTRNEPKVTPAETAVTAESSSASEAETDTAGERPETTAESSSETETAEKETSESETSASEVTETETSSETAAPDDTSADASESSDPAHEISFGQVVFVGDSRTLSLSSGGSLEYRLVPDDAVCATWGGQLNEQSAHDNATNAALKGRKKAIFWYGINDVQLNPDRGNPFCFIANYDRVIATYRSVNPDSELYFLSVLDTSVNEKDYYEGQSENIVKYNQALDDYCTEHGYHFIDITALFGDDIFAEGDNIHFSKEWYEQKFLPTVTDQAELFAEPIG